MRNLYLAYAATWFIHALFLVSLGRRFSRLKREFDDLKRK
ncbi:MAG: CcmD family protein [Acidobacteria bacterium]|nr:CcmD family protein [Acidobacteriota bacterium]